MKCALAGSFFGIPLILDEYMPKQNITGSYFCFLCSAKFLSCNIYQTVFWGVVLFGSDYFPKQFADSGSYYLKIMYWNTVDSCISPSESRNCSYGYRRNKLASTEGRFYSWVLKSWKSNCWHSLNHRATSSTSLFLCDSFIGSLQVFVYNNSYKTTFGEFSNVSVSFLIWILSVL